MANTGGNSTATANKVVLVTGGSRGLGRAICEQLAKAGYDVAVNYAGNAEAAADTVAACRAAGVRAEAVQADVADEAQVHRMVADTTAKLGGLYGVVANAGITPGYQDVDEIDPALWRRVYDVNVHGVFYTFQAAAAVLKPQGVGRLIAMSSLSTRTLSPGFGAYASTKAAVEAIVTVTARELAQHGITVNGVAPGLFDTDMGRGLIDKLGEAQARSGIPLQRFGRPEEVGDLVTYLMGEQASFMTGETTLIHGGGRIGVRVPKD